MRRYTNEIEPKLVSVKRKRDGLGRKIYYDADNSRMYERIELLKWKELSDKQQRMYLLAQLRYIRLLNERMDDSFKRFDSAYRLIGIDSWEVR